MTYSFGEQFELQAAKFLKVCMSFDLEISCLRIYPKAVNMMDMKTGLKEYSLYDSF